MTKEEAYALSDLLANSMGSALQDVSIDAAVALRQLADEVENLDALCTSGEKLIEKSYALREQVDARTEQAKGLAEALRDLLALAERKLADPDDLSEIHEARYRVTRYFVEQQDKTK